MAEKGSPDQSGRIASLDGIRALSIALVLFCHTSGTRFFPSFEYIRQYAGNFGVRVFFVVSGFLITTLLLEELSKTGRISLKWFYFRRFFRIFPAAYAFILVFSILAFLGVVELSLPQILHAFTYTVNYQKVSNWNTGHLWSLSVEEQFYLLWPAVLAISGRKKGMWIAAAAMVIAPALRTAGHYWAPSPRWNYVFEANMDTLATGCLLAGLRQRLADSASYCRFRASRAFLVVPAVGVAAYFLQGNPAFGLPLGFTLMNVSIALCIERAVRSRTDLLGRFLNWGPLSFVGVLSYSLYLWQEPFLNRLGTSPLCWFPINLICAGSAALASYYLVERPFLKLRKGIERSHAATASRSVSASS
jgi:peptidoglycan/LPS O-acetylase OafA/YrhL